MKKKEEKKNKTFLDSISMGFSKIILGNVILNVIFLIFGIIFYSKPFITATTVGVIIGLNFLLFGVYDIYMYLMRKDNPIFGSKIFLGILSIILGFFIMFNPFKIIKILTFALGLYLIVVSVFKVMETLKLKKYGYDGWSLMLVVSILLLIFGIFITINPMASMDVIEAAGIFMILASILEICNLLMVYSKAKDIAKLLKKMK